MYYVIVDTDTIGNCIAMEVPLENESPITQRPTIMLPDNSTITATYVGTLIIPQYSTKIIYL